MYHTLVNVGKVVDDQGKPSDHVLYPVLPTYASCHKWVLTGTYAMIPSKAMVMIRTKDV